MSSLGIMTLTRAPCELDKMSLFQDLKLKRRKVDSRCSSDGESVADTSTSSPDLVSPSSPKISSEAQMNPPSPDSTPIQLHPPEPTLEKISGRLEDSGVFDGGGGGGGDTTTTTTTTTTATTTTTSITTTTTTTTSVIRSLPVRSHSPPIRPAAASPSPTQPPRPHSSPGRPANASPVIIHNPNIIVQPSAVSPSKLPTTTTIVTCQQEPPTSSSPPLPPPPTTKQRGVIITQPPSALTQSQLWLKHSRINGVKPELIGGSFTGTTTLNPYSTEIKTITGSTICRTNSGNGGSGGGQPIRQTPTVIMGEAGGVRTMIWSQPATIQQQQQLSPTSVSNESLPSPQHLPTTSTWPSTNSEESAAQMLLNLGQDRLRSNSRSLLSPQSTTITANTPLNMERLWAGDLRQLPINQQTQALNLSSPTPPNYCSDMKPTIITNETTTETQQQQQQQSQQEINDDEEQPMICMICEDKATGLHYGIITCEGCKGFFKRTVQNRRVYTCVADGNCEITKAQRNRCQYCRFKKCIEQGMVLQAVREDRMPGGRNSGAVYNLYKVKYKKHKKPACKQPAKTTINTAMVAAAAAATTASTTTTTTAATTLPTDKCLLNSGQFKMEQQQVQQQHQQQQQPSQQQQQQPSSIPSNLVNGTILKTALTNPSEVVRLRQRLDSAVSSSRDRNFSIEYSLSMIKTLIDCDEFQDIATLQNLDDLLEPNTDLSEKLCHIGDSIVYKLVQWTKRLPFYLELPVEVHTRLLTHKWHELLVLTTSAYQAIHKYNCNEQQSTVVIKADFNHEVDTNLCTLQGCLTSMMGREITIDQLRQDVGCMIEKITHVTIMFRQLKLSMEEYVCLKVITMLNQAKPASSSGNSELETIYERYMTCLRVYTQHMYPQQTTRFQELLGRLPEIQSAAALLLESKMFYVPFLLNSAIQR